MIPDETGFPELPNLAKSRRTTGSGKQTRASSVLAAVRAAIIAGELAPGRRINLNALREQHGISLSPLREAVARLAQERLVVVEDQRGFRAAPVSGADLCEVLDLRTDLTALALSLAIERGDIEWEGQVLSAAHRLRKNPDAGGGPSDLLRAMVSGCGRPMLLDFCAVLDNLHLRYLNILGLPANVSQTDLSPIADAAVGRKKDLAIALLREWMERAGASVLQQWNAEAAGRGGS